MSKRKKSDEAYKELMDSIDLSETVSRGTRRKPRVHPGGTHRYTQVDPSDKVRRTFILTEELLDDLLRYCERTKQLPSHVVRKAIEKYIAKP